MKTCIAGVLGANTNTFRKTRETRLGHAIEPRPETTRNPAALGRQRHSTPRGRVRPEAWHFPAATAVAFPEPLGFRIGESVAMLAVFGVWTRWCMRSAFTFSRMSLHCRPKAPERRRTSGVVGL